MSLNNNRKIVIPIIMVLIGVLVVTAVILLLKVQPEESSPEGCASIVYEPNIDYNFVGSLDFTLEKQTSEFLEIKAGRKNKLFSLGKFTLNLEPNTVLKIPKLWLYFFSEKLSDREDGLYGLRDSYLSNIILKTGSKTQEINLGRSGEHSFIELVDCPLGNIYPVDKETELDFEFLLEIGCNDYQDGVCLDSDGKSLDYIDGADLLAKVRLFVESFQNFTKDIIASTSFEYK